MHLLLNNQTNVLLQRQYINNQEQDLQLFNHNHKIIE